LYARYVLRAGILFNIFLLLSNRKVYFRVTWRRSYDALNWLNNPDVPT